MSSAAELFRAAQREALFDMACNHRGDFNASGNVNLVKISKIQRHTDCLNVVTPLNQVWQDKCA